MKKEKKKYKKKKSPAPNFLESRHQKKRASAQMGTGSQPPRWCSWKNQWLHSSQFQSNLVQFGSASETRRRCGYTRAFHFQLH